MKWGQAAAKLEAAMKGNKKESEMELFVAEIIEDDSDVDEGLTFEVGVFRGGNAFARLIRRNPREGVYEWHSY